MNDNNNMQDTMATLVLVLAKWGAFDSLVAALGAVFITLGIIKNLLDIRYHPVLKKRKRHDQKRRSDSPSDSESL